MESRELAIYALLVGAFTALTVITPAFISGYMTIDLLIIAQSIVLTTLAVTGIEALGIGCIAGVIEFIMQVPNNSTGEHTL